MTVPPPSPQSPSSSSSSSPDYGRGLVERELHRTLLRQLRRFDLTPDGVPTESGWKRLLSAVSAAYREAEENRYTIERALTVSTQEMRALQETLEQQARTDPLTALANRAGLMQLLDAAVLSNGRTPGPGVLYLDLDGFKAVNDTLGHGAGDQLLIEVGVRLRASIRATDVAARLGGDEFIVLCPATDSLEALTATGQRILQRLEEPFLIEGTSCHVSASIGVAACPPEAGVTTDELLTWADGAMYRAKAAGKGRIVVHE